MSERVKIAELRLQQVDEREKESMVRLERAKLREEGVLDLQESLFSPQAQGPGTPQGPAAGNMSVAMVATMQDEIAESHARYIDLENEHEDLLALLAQQQLEKDTLKSALVKSSGGDEAVIAAQREAEQLCIERYQHYIKM